MANNFMKKKPMKPRGLKPKEITQELEEEVVEQAVEELTDDSQENSEQAPEEVIEETVNDVSDDDSVDDIEEDNELLTVETNSPEEIVEIQETDAEEETETEVPEVIEEEKPKKKRTRKAKKKVEETSVEEESFGAPVSIEEAEELIEEIISPCPSYWEEEKTEVEGILSKLTITEELDPTSLKTLLADMSSAYNELVITNGEAAAEYKNLEETIDVIKSQYSIGSSADERKSNALKAVTHYRKDEESECVDLMAYLKFKRIRKEFYSSALKTIELNRQLLITFSAAFKLELASY